MTGAQRLPLWFIEGMAEYLSIGPVDPQTAMWLRDAMREEELPTIADLNDPQYFPYRWGHAFWSYVAGKWGDGVIREMLTVGGTAGPGEAIEQVLGITSEALSEEWQATIRGAYEPILKATTPPEDSGRLVLERDGGGNLNIGPALSPDGRWIAFLSERSQFSIDLYIADSATGNVVHQLTSTATDPHVSSLQFIHSAGGWDAESRRLVIATVTAGRPALAVFDAESGRSQREFPIDAVDEIFNPTWSPDGDAIAFTGMARGLTDLYVLDLESASLRRLTNDPYADLQPAWSPDGRRIAFATDRFSTRLETLDIGPLRLAVIDPESGRVEAVPSFATGKSMNPQWAPGGQALYFLSDHDGITNVYRTTLADGTLVRLTNLSTGVSGITSTSPALSVASQSGLAAFSAYDGGNHRIFALDTGEAPVVSVSSPAAVTLPPAAVLPAIERRPSDVVRLLGDALFGLPPAQEYEVAEYTPKLTLEAIGQPTIAIGADRFGAAIGGGMGFYFGDMLGNRSLVTSVQLNAGLSSNFSWKNTGIQALYANQSKRLTWGVLGGQTPYLSGGILQGTGTINGEPAQIDQSIIDRQTDRNVSGLLTYPFSRAQRVEFQAGMSQLSFDRVIETEAYSLRTGQLLVRETQDEPIADSLSQVTSSAALVYDTSVFGATSPLQGQRYRFEAAPTFGGIDFVSLLADYRRYVMPAPFYTLAGRVMHYGRYGSGSEDQRLFPLFLGYPSLVRGYDLNSFGTADCGDSPTGGCPLSDRLFGSRVLVGNLEWRFPLMRPFGATSYGNVPIDVALFADGGVAWNRGDRPAIFGGDRDGVSSVGVTLRANMLGFAIGQFDFTRPLQRRSQGWVFQFTLAPGF